MNNSEQIQGGKMSDTEKTIITDENLSDLDLENKIKEIEKLMREKVIALNKKGNEDDQELEDLMRKFLTLAEIQSQKGTGKETYQERVTKYREMCKTKKVN